MERHKFEVKATRRHFISRQDCRNATRKLRDFSKHRHQNDAISVHRIVNELTQEKPSSIIAYKPHGVLDKNYSQLEEKNFSLVIMTDFQATLFSEFSSLLCLDSTHKTNEYGYKLITAVVVDEFRNGMQPKDVYVLVCNAKCILSEYRPANSLGYQ